MNNHPAETAAIVRAWQFCDADVQERCARDARQANDAESWGWKHARVIALWQDELHGRDYLATVAQSEIDRRRRKLAAADADMDDVLRGAVAEAVRSDDELKADAADLFRAATQRAMDLDAERQRKRLEGDQ